MNDRLLYRTMTLGFACWATVWCEGCGTNYTALAPGNPMPQLVVEGWANDRDPGELSGKVIVMEAFATW